MEKTTELEREPVHMIEAIKRLADRYDEEYKHARTAGDSYTQGMYVGKLSHLVTISDALKPAMLASVKWERTDGSIEFAKNLIKKLRETHENLAYSASSFKQSGHFVMAQMTTIRAETFETVLDVLGQIVGDLTKLRDDNQQKYLDSIKVV